MNLGLFVIDKYSFQAREAGGCTNQAPSQGFHFIDVIVNHDFSACLLLLQLEIDPTLSRPRPAPSSSIDQAYFRCYCLYENILRSFHFVIKDHVVVFLEILLLSLLRILLLTLPQSPFILSDSCDEWGGRRDTQSPHPECC